MNEEMREDAILWEVEPEGAVLFGGGSIRIPSYHIGVVVREGEVVDCVREGKRTKLPRGREVQTYLASALQFSVEFLLKDPRDGAQPGEGVALDWKGLTMDGKLVRGSIELKLRVVPDKGSVKGLLQLLPREGGPVTKWEIAGALKGELQKNVTRMILGLAEEGLQEIGELLKARLESKVRGYGLCLDDVRDALEANVRQPLDKQCTAPGTDGEDAVVSALHEAAGRGDTDKVLSLVSAGADVNAALDDDVGFASTTALHKAASGGHTETVLALVSAGADINRQRRLKYGDKLSQTPLHEAASGGHTETVLALVKADANVNVSDEVGGFTPLHRAVLRDDLEMVSAFISAGADLDAMSEGGSPLHWAVWSGHMECMRALIDAGADVDVRDKSGGMPLHVAVLSISNSPVEAVRALVKAGADINARSEGGETPLHGAALESRADVMRALVDAGAEVDARDDYGKTPLHKAAGQGDTDTVRALITDGADVNARSDGGETDDEDETAYWSREDVTARSEGGVTALHWAALMGHTETTRALISEGADVNARNEEGQTALHWAAMRGRRETVQALVFAGADIYAKDEEGFTPSFLAAVEEDEEIARELDDLAKGERDEPPSEVGPPARRPQSPDAPATPSYWVYEDKVTASACVHEGACSFCNHGEGMGKGRNEKENEWHGPYPSRTEAFRGARETGRQEVRGCTICRP